MYRTRGFVPRRPEEQLSEFIRCLFYLISNPFTGSHEYLAKYYRNLVESIVLRLNGVELDCLDPDRMLKDKEFYGRDSNTMKRWQEGIREGREEMKQRFGSQCHQAQDCNKRRTN
jgi:hypothetical protein